MISIIMTNISCSIKESFNINIKCRNWKNVFYYLNNYKISFIDFLSQFKKILIIFNRKNKILKIILNFKMKSCFRFWLLNIFKIKSFWFMISIDCMWFWLQMNYKTMRIISLIIITKILFVIFTIIFSVWVLKNFVNNLCDKILW